MLKDFVGRRTEKRDRRGDPREIGRYRAEDLLQGAAGLPQYDDTCVADPAVRALRSKVAFEEDGSVPVEAAIVTIHLADGTTHSEHIRHGRGTPGSAWPGRPRRCTRKPACES